MTIRDLLTSIAPCPVPDSFYEAIGSEVRVDLDTDMTEASPVAVNRYRARLYLYLATAPNVSEGGVSISFTPTDKKLFLDLARRFAKLAGEEGLIPGATYGYKGQDL